MTLRYAFIAGLIYFLPYLAGSPYVFVFLIPTLILIFSGSLPRKAAMQFILAGSCGLMLLPVLAYDPAVYLLAVLITGGFLAIFVTITAYLTHKLSDNPVSVFIPCAVWSALIFLFDGGALLRSAFDVGVLLPVSAPLIWVTGSIGITVLIVLFNSAVARAIVRRDKLSIGIAAVLALVFAFSMIYSAGSVSLGEGERRSSYIALIQGDVPAKGFGGYREDLDSRIARYAELSREAALAGAGLIVWPEFALPIDVMNRFPEKFTPVLDVISNTGKDHIIGSMLTAGEKNYNTALIFNDAAVLERVWYSERPAVFNRDISAGTNNSSSFPDGMGILMCWEEIDPEVASKYAREGATSFLSLSSNADLDRSWLKKYISYFSRARAAENRRYLARVAQTGITQIVDPYGRVYAAIPPDKSAFLQGTVYHEDISTFYSRNGDIITSTFSAVCGAVILGMLLAAADVRSKLFCALGHFCRSGTPMAGPGEGAK